MNKVIPILIGIVIVVIAAGVYFATSFENDLTLTEGIDGLPEQKGQDFTLELDEGLGLAEP